MAVGVLHFSHMSSIAVVEAMGATNNRRLSKHLKIYTLFFIELSVALSVISYAISFPWNSWNIAVSLFCSEILFKVSMLIIVFAFFYLWDILPLRWCIKQDFDDVLSNIKLFSSCVLFLFGCAIFVNGMYVLIFDSGGKIRALLLGLHAYSTIFLQCRDGWRKFQLRRSASKKLQQLKTVCFYLEDPNNVANAEVCAICYAEMEVAVQTKCMHHFHKNCLLKWIYVQTFCPLCKVELN